MHALRSVLKILWTMFKWGFLIVLILVVGAAAYLTYAVHTRLPDHDATVASSELDAEVRVVRDEWGVPHILAENEPDAYYALGYCMAQDRIFQMELLRRLAAGELAELIGPVPPVVKVDRIMRAFRLRAKAAAYVDQQEQLPPDLRAAMDAFIAGVNQFMDDGPLPWEFAALQIPRRSFTKVDCLSVAAILPITFADGLRGDPVATMLEQRYPDLDVDRLFPGYSFEAVTIMETLDEARDYLDKQAPKALGTEAAPELSPAAAVDSMMAWLDGMTAYTDRAGHHLGSNSWVLAPSRTQSGEAILANDPHVGFTNPGIWYEAHLKYEDFENYGYHFPPIPIPLLGHNEDRGWGLTMFANDDVDLYLEKFHPEDPHRVMYKGEWVECEVVEETIKVRFAPDVKTEVRITPHGPVVTDLFEILHGYEGPPIALRWVWQNVEYTDVLAFYRMSHARTYDEFAEAVGMITSPGLNFSYVDAEGNIAWWAAGLLPIRPAEVHHKHMLEGWHGRHEITKYLPRSENPHLKNPPWGYIVTANNMSTVKPLGEPPLQLERLQGYWQPGDRAARIEEILDTRNDWTIEDLKAVQMDDYAWAAPKIVPALIELARTHDAELAPRERRALQLLEEWDYRHPPESAGAAVYQYFTESVITEMLKDELGPDLLKVYMSLADHWNAFKELLHDADAPFWDDRETPEIETREAIVVRALHDAVAAMSEAMGEDPDQWAWGKVHTMEFKHPFGYLPGIGKLLNIGPFPASGSAQAINNMLYSGRHNFDVIAGPSTRRLIDYKDPSRFFTILPTGNSGHVGSEHYDDQAEMFVNGEYREGHYTWSAIEAHKEHEMRFRPE
ncbi:MAG: penicillin acylase family protein [Candidatus Hydrogenedentota bacterium]